MLIYGWGVAEAAERVDTEQGRYTEDRKEKQGA